MGACSAWRLGANNADWWADLDPRPGCEGGPVWRPAVRLRSGERVLLSELWSHDRVSVEKSVAVVAETCRLGD